VPHSKASLVDDLGNTYKLKSASVGFGTDQQGNILTGATSTFTFDGPLAANASSLTLKVEGSGGVLSGPWAFPITLP
jgi:hypothetical protein